MAKNVHRFGFLEAIAFAKGKGLFGGWLIGVGFVDFVKRGSGRDAKLVSHNFITMLLFANLK